MLKLINDSTLLDPRIYLFNGGAYSALEIAECLSLSWIHRTNFDKLPSFQKRKLSLAQKKNTVSAWEFYHIFLGGGGGRGRGLV